MRSVPRACNVSFGIQTSIFSGLQCKSLALETLHHVLLLHFHIQPIKRFHIVLAVSLFIMIQRTRIPWDSDNDGRAIRKGLQGFPTVDSLERWHPSTVYQEITDFLDLITQIVQRSLPGVPLSNSFELRCVRSPGVALKQLTDLKFFDSGRANTFTKARFG